MRTWPPHSGRSSHTRPRTCSYIRQTMERSATFTAVPGAGGVVMGVIGLAAAGIGARQPTSDRWLATWLVAAAIAAVVGLVFMSLKARKADMTLTGVNTRRFALGMAAPFVAGAAITYDLWAVRNFTVMAPSWLLLYGAGLLTGGMFSVRGGSHHRRVLHGRGPWRHPHAARVGQHLAGDWLRRLPDRIRHLHREESRWLDQVQHGSSTRRFRTRVPHGSSARRLPRLRPISIGCSTIACASASSARWRRPTRCRSPT